MMPTIAATAPDAANASLTAGSVPCAASSVKSAPAAATLPRPWLPWALQTWKSRTRSHNVRERMCTHRQEPSKKALGEPRRGFCNQLS